MRATRIEFRLRVAIIVATLTLGFWAPWTRAWGLGARDSLLGWLALALTRQGLAPFAVATPLVIVAGAAVAAVGAALRFWGTAWLGSFVMTHGEMKAGAVLADGPYRFVRNPLYLGNLFMFAALALLMPPSGAVFALVLLTVFMLRLIFGEEAFLAASLGEPYLRYKLAVPRLLPKLHTSLEPTGRKPRWLHAVLAELSPIGIFITLAFLSWSYDNQLMVKAVIVSFGAQLVARALLPAAETGDKS